METFPVSKFRTTRYIIKIKISIAGLLPAANEQTTNLNINLPEHNNPILKLEVELRDKHRRPAKGHHPPKVRKIKNVDEAFVPMEKVCSILSFQIICY
jgi:hypothetical protein